MEKFRQRRDKPLLLNFFSSMADLYHFVSGILPRAWYSVNNARCRVQTHKERKKETKENKRGVILGTATVIVWAPPIGCRPRALSETPPPS